MNRRKYNQEETQQEKMEKLEKLAPKGKKKCRLLECLR